MMPLLCSFRVFKLSLLLNEQLARFLTPGAGVFGFSGSRRFGINDTAEFLQTGGGMIFCWHVFETALQWKILRRRSELNEINRWELILAHMICLLALSRLDLNYGLLTVQVFND
jgi:hypothetical protein